MTRRAFTLIELLVVVAIIAILASLLFPVFTSAKNAAKKTVSMNNVKQISLGSMLYMNDFDDYTMPLFTYNPGDTSYPTSFGFHYYPLLILPYINSEKVFVCPNDWQSDETLKDSQGRERFDPANELHHYIFGANPSYGYNYRYLNKVTVGYLFGRPTPKYAGVSATFANSPAETIMFAEATMKDKTVRGGGGASSTVTTEIGYSRIEPPHGVSVPAPLPPYNGWTGTFPNAQSQGQLWGRFDEERVITMWLDGHVSYPAIASLKGHGASEDEVNRLWNGRGSY